MNFFSHGSQDLFPTCNYSILEVCAEDSGKLILPIFDRLASHQRPHVATIVAGYNLLESGCHRRWSFLRLHQVSMIFNVQTCDKMLTRRLLQSIYRTSARHDHRLHLDRVLHSLVAFA